MKIIKSNIEISLEFTPAVNIDDTCFFDIETTGLSREYHSIYLIGALYYNKSSNDWTLVQFFADNLCEEEELLTSFIDMVKDFEILVTYNGDSFDIPFVKRRLEKYLRHWDGPKSIDLYKYVKNHRSMLGMPNLKLKTLEKHLGIFRDDLISGKDCIGLYRTYTSTNDDELLHPILQHNYDDLQYMPYLLEIYNIVEKHKTIEISYLNPTLRFSLDTVDFAEEKLMVKGSYNPNLSVPWSFYKSFYTLILDGGGIFRFEIETRKVRLSEDIIADIVDARSIEDMSVKSDLSPHETPEGILILRANKELYMENIKMIIENLFIYHLNSD
jgi:uncharacterized protein YprB with RNaseH-like and TPR domain